MKVTVISSRNQGIKTTFESTAKTLGQLKDDFNDNNIEYEGLSIYEAISRTKLIDNDSVLPHDLDYRGQKTDDLLIYMTPDKKISSGVLSKRQSLYAAIKSRNLADDIKKKYGKSYTNLSTIDLDHIVSGVSGTASSETPTQVEHIDSKSEDLPERVVCDAVSSTTTIDDLLVKVNSLNDKLSNLVILLSDYYNGDTDSDEMSDSLKTLEDDTDVPDGSTKSVGLDSPFSDNDINDLIKSL